MADCNVYIQELVKEKEKHSHKNVMIFLETGNSCILHTYQRQPQGTLARFKLRSAKDISDASDLCNRQSKVFHRYTM